MRLRTKKEQLSPMGLLLYISQEEATATSTTPIVLRRTKHMAKDAQGKGREGKVGAICHFAFKVNQVVPLDVSAAEVEEVI